MQQGGNGYGGTAPQEDANDAAGQTKDHGFDEELAEDVACAGAHGHADADFAGSLGHGDEHDVHDAHATDGERNKRDDQEEIGHYAAGVGKGLSNLGVVADPEVVRTAKGDVVTVAEHGVDLSDGQRDVLGGASGNPDVVE